MNDNELINLYESYRNIYENPFENKQELNNSVLDYLIDEGYTDSYESALVILETMSDEWFENLIEANRWERHNERKFKQSEKELPKYNATKDIAMMKARRREGDFLRGATHSTTERETPYANPGTHAYSANLKSQRKRAHKSERNKEKKKAGSSSEDRATEANWRKLGMPRNSGRMEKMSKNERTQLKDQLKRQGERRRGLRSQAVRSLGRTLGWAHIDSQGIN